MDKKELERYRRVLEKVRSRILQNMTELETSQLESQSQPELVGITTHPADQGTDNFERDLNLGFLNNSNLSLQEIDEALKRIKNGTYGYCEHCGCEISAERLSALPHTRYCLDCQSTKEF